MTVPTRPEAVASLCSLAPPDWAVAHARATAEVAAWLGGRIARRGTRVDVRAIETAALLHDADKSLPRDHPLRVLPHGIGSAAWLAERGFPELGPLVADHPVTRLADDLDGRPWFADAPLEALVVAYADKRAELRRVSLDARFRSWWRRYPDTWDDATWARVQTRAMELERVVCGAAGAAPSAVGRVAWTRPWFAAKTPAGSRPR